STAYFVQPISVPAENKDHYKSAYRVKMMVSDLNSAYFVYNPAGDFSLELFQEQRFTALRMIEDYSDVPSEFLDYYTEMPKGGGFDSLRLLALKIADTAGSAPINKILAIRNFFTAVDSSGNPTFRYSDNPGIPGIPGANRLSHFLFESKKGYCAYYAGATLFLLRALGIPSRIATGFLTVDRSNKNPGWYWFYEDQAHAWVQVWFPGYGWLDFDTTVPSSETQEAPQPDQTPPLTSQTAWFVANGTILSTDKEKARLRMNITDVLFKDLSFKTATPYAYELDISMAKILKDTGMVTTDLLKPGVKIVAVSFSDIFKEINLDKNETWETLQKKWPTPLPIDEIKIIDPVPEEKVNEIQTGKLSIPWIKIAIGCGIALLIATVIALLIPIIIFKWFVFKSSHSENIYRKTYYSYMASMFYLHQLGKKRFGQTPLQFAEKEIDPMWGTGLGKFISTYEKLKYSKSPLSKAEINTLSIHLPEFIKTIKSKIPLSQRIKSFLKINNTIEFFTRPNILGSTKSMEIWKTT
nr:transglutaminase-like domain-containing protein [Chitinophagaceae bacterium]